MADTLTIVVDGIPAPQGSKRHVGGGRMVESSKKVGPWRAAVEAAARTEIAATGWTKPAPDKPTIVNIVFYLPRPKSHFGTGRNTGKIKEHHRRTSPVTKPDLDKLVRSTLDALTDAGAWTDDSQVTGIEAHKQYTALRGPGANIDIYTYG